jgi:hypothetical protein
LLTGLADSLRDSAVVDATRKTFLTTSLISFCSLLHTLHVLLFPKDMPSSNTDDGLMHRLLVASALAVVVVIPAALYLYPSSS